MIGFDPTPFVGTVLTASDIAFAEFLATRSRARVSREAPRPKVFTRKVRAYDRETEMQRMFIIGQQATNHEGATA